MKAQISVHIVRNGLRRFDKAGVDLSGVTAGLSPARPKGEKISQNTVDYILYF
ncbi:hypothetical protein [Desulfoluna sp.]|uniref:hypothetical protein n=1 Tax=Desulfoluna sp. TaxID=2045199 RepID=UPI00261B001A|nr:hypothetical protein [Desulfoluna sp.]